LLCAGSFARRLSGAQVVALVFLGLLAACANPVASPPGSPSTGPGERGSAGGDCAQIDISTPSGERIDLNGTWATEREGIRGGIYYFRQIGSCVWFAGGFPPPSETDVPSLLGFLTVVFRGEVANDLTISGDWVDVRHQAPGPPGLGGTMELALEFTDAGDLRLVYVGGTGLPFVEPGYREEQSWVKLSEGSAYPPATSEPAP
jgi:hypothetical protein